MKIRSWMPMLACLAAAPAAEPRHAAAQVVEAEAIVAQQVPLDDLGAFRSPGANWRIAGGASAPPGARRMALEPGTGVLVNVAPSGQGENLLTEWEHGDLELELEFQMAPGSNSGIYLQGRYEVQLLDSWGKPRPTFGDAGGIYQRWDPARGQGREGFEGQAPRVNASRAPGLWQTLRIHFRAPRFDAAGRKVQNARFVRVEHNGALIHDNVEVTGPTRGPIAEDERPLGPLMLQGDHGPVAFRNIRYKRFSGERVQLAGLRYRAYQGEWSALPDLAALTPTRQGAAEGISSALSGVQDKFAVAVEGTMEVPETGDYLFQMRLPWVGDDPHFTGKVVGGGRLAIDGREALLHPGTGPVQTARVRLEQGRHPFTLTWFKNRPWTDRFEIGLFVEGTGVERHALHDQGALPPPSLPGAVLVEPEREPAILRSFMLHGDGKRTHVVSVGDPTGVHFSFDAARGGLLYAWRGPFVEATPMWHGRGTEQTAIPRGSVLPLSGEPAVAALPDLQRPWPDSTAAGYRFEGYQLDAEGRPTFRYRLGAAEVEDRIRPVEGRTLARELRVRAPGGGPLYVRVAAGERIRPLEGGRYAVGDLTYYVAMQPGAARPVVRQVAGGQELLVPLRLRGDQAALGYQIIW